MSATITRLYHKERTHFTITPELDAALDELVGHGKRSAFVERAVWSRLIEECGEEAVLDAVEQAHSEPETDAEQLLEPREIEL